MNDNGNSKPSGLVSPQGQPLGEETFATATIGGQDLRYFKQPNQAQAPALDLRSIQQMAAGHDLMLHSLVRELVLLRARVAALEACETEQEILS